MQGMAMRAGMLKEFELFIVGETAKWKRVIAAANIRIN